MQTGETLTTSIPSTVALFGEVLVDIFPDRKVLGGAPFNVARHLQTFGLHALLISRTGHDALRHTLLREMEVSGMDRSGIQLDRDHPTGQVQVSFENGNHRFDILPDQAYDHICAIATRQAMTATQPRLAYFGSLAQRSTISREAASQFMQSCNCPLFLDINLRAPWYTESTVAASLEAASIVKLNEDELAEVARMFDLQHLQPEAQALALQDRFKIRQVLVTCSASGSWLLDERQYLHSAIATPPADFKDTVGAGDAYAAVFMLGLVSGWDLTITLQRAGDYAAALCGVRGAAPPSAGVIHKFRQAWSIDGIPQR